MDEKLKDLIKRIKYANTHLKTSIETETMSEFKPSLPITSENVIKISREFEKWQVKKRFLQKRENFAVKIFHFNNKINNNIRNETFNFNYLPKDEEQLKIFEKYLNKLNNNIKTEDGKIVLSDNFTQIKDSIIRDMLKRRYISEKDTFSKYDTLDKLVQKSFSKIASLHRSILELKSEDNLIPEHYFPEFKLKYHRKFIDTAKNMRFNKLAEWIKEMGPYMSYYLYIKQFEIGDFYTDFLEGLDDSEIINNIARKLSCVSEPSRDKDFSIKEYDEEIKKFVKTLHDQ
ncbi:hypothetical protein BAnh1_01010 [Bartonella australis AUST/NH1]|uniref:Uncharacterized protein n=1 Tax=Bartonella australis (strain Aust/NH1) TaxID=1094489 RepID=M1N279_BARAA|nr:hypothetical protein [Bartonella australis]AGF73994.1 hypothetical protein BAnh1_01010 [Bartonella australis AUST/NH1]